MNSLLTLYKEWCGKAPHKIETLPKAGSNRQYVRMFAADGSSVIGVIGTSTDENRCFVYLASHFTAQSLPMPKIYAFSDDESCYIQEDLGDTSLYKALAKARANQYYYSSEDKELLSKTIKGLARVQVKGVENLDFSRCIEPKRFDKTAAMFDLNYFKYCFLKTTDLPFDEVKLEADFVNLAHDLVGCTDSGQYFLYRDFQARNIMLDEYGNPHFIDFQGGMQGPLQYDVASFLWQASARYSQTMREQLISDYIEELRQLLPNFDEESFRYRLQLFVLFRILQVLGAYGLRGYVERKKYFLDSIPLAIQNLRCVLSDGVGLPYAYLNSVLHKLVNLPRFSSQQPSELSDKTKQADDTRLIVRVFSFSYKKGIPEDTSGNGGGYVFDCRSTHNPGRYEPYKKLTGLDEPVIKFLEEDGEILTFLDSVYRLADVHVARYLERGFTNLMFSFGCTGGQHRSVYSAQHLAEHIHKKFGIIVKVCHREQGIEATYPALVAKSHTD